MVKNNKQQEFINATRDVILSAGVSFNATRSLTCNFKKFSVRNFKRFFNPFLEHNNLGIWIPKKDDSPAHPSWPCKREKVLEREAMIIDSDAPIREQRKQRAEKASHIIKEGTRNNGFTKTYQDTTYKTHLSGDKAGGIYYTSSMYSQMNMIMIDIDDHKNKSLSGCTNAALYISHFFSRFIL